MGSRARVYFETFVGEGASAVLQNLVASKAREDEHLDFKHGAPKEEHIDAIWSKALGAFANNQGGVVVWGIKADRDNVEKLDFAHSLALAPDVYILRERLAQKYRFLTDPPLPLVEIIPVPFREGAKDGFVVCYIPEGSQKAYKSTKSKYPYYLRIGSDAAEVGNGLLRQLFYPKIHHKLSLHIGAQRKVPLIMRIEAEELSPNHKGRCISVGVKNDGDFSVYEATLLVKHGRNPLVRWKWDRFKRNFGYGFLEDGAIILGSPLHPTLRSVVNVMAIGENSDTTKWSIRVLAKDMKPFDVEIDQATLATESGEPLVIPIVAGFDSGDT